MIADALVTRRRSWPTNAGSVFPPVFRLGLLFALVILACAAATLFIVLPLLPWVFQAGTAGGGEGSRR